MSMLETNRGWVNVASADRVAVNANISKRGTKSYTVVVYRGDQELEAEVYGDPDIEAICAAYLPAAAGHEAVVIWCDNGKLISGRPDEAIVSGPYPIVAWRMSNTDERTMAIPVLPVFTGSGQTVLVALPNGAFGEAVDEGREWSNLEEAKAGVLQRSQIEWDDDRARETKAQVKETDKVSR